MLDRRGGELFDTKAPPPVTVPALSCLKVPVVDDGAERREVAARFLEARIIKTGAECWQAIGRAESFEARVKIGRALQIGHAECFRGAKPHRFPDGGSIRYAHAPTVSEALDELRVPPRGERHAAGVERRREKLRVTARRSLGRLLCRKASRGFFAWFRQCHRLGCFT